MALSVPAPIRWISAITARGVALAFAACPVLASGWRPRWDPGASVPRPSHLFGPAACRRISEQYARPREALSLASWQPVHHAPYLDQGGPCLGEKCFPRPTVYSGHDAGDAGVVWGGLSGPARCTFMRGLTDCGTWGEYLRGRRQRRAARSSIIQQSRPVPQSTGSRSDSIVFGAIVSDVIQLRRQR